jgi:hypothetical protein
MARREPRLSRTMSSPKPPKRTRAPAASPKRMSAPADLAAFLRFGQISARTQASARNRRRCHAFWSQRGAPSCVLVVTRAAVVRFGRGGLVVRARRTPLAGGRPAGPHPAARIRGPRRRMGLPPNPLLVAKNERPPRYIEAGSAAAAKAAAAASRRSTSAGTTGATSVPISSIAASRPRARPRPRGVACAPATTPTLRRRSVPHPDQPQPDQRQQIIDLVDRLLHERHERPRESAGRNHGRR